MAKEKIEISSQEAKDKLKAGEELSGFHIERLTYSKNEIDFPIHIVDCTIGTLDLNHAIVKEDITIRRCRIDMCVLSEASFHKKFDFKKSSVGRGRFQRVEFQGNANFSETVLAYTSFHQSTFGQKSDFSRSTFVGDGTFSEVTFHDYTKFIYGQFKDRGIFNRCNFLERADFKHIVVNKDMEMNNATFRSGLFLMGAVIHLSLSMSGCEFHGRTDLSSLTVGRSLSLLDVTVGKDQGFRFLNANANPIVFQRDVVEGHVWPESEGDYAGAAREYGFLRTAFEHINRFDDEDWAYYQFKRNERRGRPMTSNPIDWTIRAGNFLFLDVGCGYGTKPFRTLGVMGVLMAFFALCYFIGGLPVPNGVTYGLSSPLFNQVVHSMYGSLLAFSGSLADVKLNGLLRLLGMIEYLFGVVFMGLFIVAFSRKVIR